jgi:hypothetical protein
VALALIAQASAFEQGFRLFALLVLPIMLLVGIGTMLRLSEALPQKSGELDGGADDMKHHTPWRAVNGNLYPDHCIGPGLAGFIAKMIEGLIQ